MLAERQWKEHQKFATEGGSRLIGAYEGGSHLKPPKELSESKEFMKWWRDYHWGPQGADVARSINKELIETFPGVIVANYESIGELSAANPWIDGHYARPTPMLRMWDEFARPDRLPQ